MVLPVWVVYSVYTNQRVVSSSNIMKRRHICDRRPVFRYAVDRQLSASANHRGLSAQTAWRMWQGGALPAQHWPAGTGMVAVPSTPTSALNALTSTRCAA